MKDNEKTCEKRLLTTAEVAKLLGISYGALSKLRKAGLGPPYLRITDKGSVRYAPDSLRVWIEQKEKHKEDL